MELTVLATVNGSKNGEVPDSGTLTTSGAQPEDPVGPRRE